MTSTNLSDLSANGINLYSSYQAFRYHVQIADVIYASSLVYDVANDEWARGTDLPAPLWRAAVAPLEQTFLVVGGNMGHVLGGPFTDKVLLYTTDGSWLEMPHMPLGEPMESPTALVVRLEV